MSQIIKELKAIQSAHGHLPAAELESLSRRLNVPLYRLQGLASFYPHFRLSPPPRLEVKVCQDMSCHLAGAGDTRAAIERACAGLAGVHVEGVSCLGRCDAPVAVAFNDSIRTALRPEGAAALAAASYQGTRMDEDASPPAGRFPGLDAYDGADAGGALLALLASRDAEGAIATLKASGLRGMGGAGFPTGVKWELVRKTQGEVKYVVCNADESEPGTFKDRAILERHADLVVEGMTIGACCVGSSSGIVYIRHEYGREKRAVEAAIGRAYAAGRLGSNLLGSGFSFDLELFESPGGYICGEETALLEALEGKRAEPRNKPPFPGTEGLWGRPTVINNVETFAFVPAILRRGAEWFKSAGRNGAAGLKLLALSGHVERPGVYEVGLGIPAEEFIREQGLGVSGGRALKAFAPGGASSGFLPASLAATPLDFAALTKVGSMLGSGAVVAIAEGTCMLDLALNVGRFFRNESCGKCVPCRVGTEKIVDLLDGVARGEGTPADLGLIDELAEGMRETSICGLGQAAPYPITSVLCHFKDEVFDHILKRHCPSGICPVGGARP